MLRKARSTKSVETRANGRWYLLGALWAAALGAEAVWGAVKFHGAWHLAYGAAAVVAFGLSAAIWRASRSGAEGAQPKTFSVAQSAESADVRADAEAEA